MSASWLSSAGHQDIGCVLTLVHCSVLPFALGLLAGQRGGALGGQVALIWMSDISFDRRLGNDLSFPNRFGIPIFKLAAAGGRDPGRHLRGCDTLVAEGPVHAG